MTANKKLNFLLKMIVVWTLAQCLLFFLKTTGPENILGENPVRRNMPLTLEIILILGVVSGILFTALELYFEKPKFKRWSYKSILILKVVLLFVFAKLIMWLGLMIFTKHTGIIPDFAWFRERMMSNLFWSLLVYFTIVAFLITFFRQVDQKFGPGVMWKMITGQFHKPKEDQRIFMFLDLKSSTTFAERLGHIKYSQLIQDCFYDLNEISPKYKAEIYQYVGDEAVLTWSVESGLQDNNCIEFYFAFAKAMQDKAEYYKSTYGIVPEFKAGVHFGPVTIAEVGVVKKEIAYHGDAINTTARIQSQCNTYNQKLLISKDLLGRLLLGEGVERIQLGDIQLKGKEEHVTLYGLVSG